MKLHPTALLLACAVLAGCARIDPYQRPYTWHPGQVNDRNLAVMVQNPRDLREGQASDGPSWTTGAQAVDRLWRDHVKPLPGNNTAVFGQTGAAPQPDGAK